MINENENGIEAKKVGKKEDMEEMEGLAEKSGLRIPGPTGISRTTLGAASIHPKLFDLSASYQNGRPCYGNPADYPICKYQSKS